MAIKGNAWTVDGTARKSVTLVNECSRAPPWTFSGRLTCCT